MLQIVCVDLVSPPAVDTEAFLITESRPAAAMFPPESSRASQTQFVSTAAAVVVVMMLSLLPVSAVEPETCFSRQHQSVRVNVRLAVNRAGTLMDTRVVASERDCVLVCCSQEVKPGERLVEFTNLCLEQ